MHEYLLRLLSLVQQSQSQAKKRSKKYPAWAAACAKVLGWRKMVQKLETVEPGIKGEPKRMVGGHVGMKQGRKERRAGPRSCEPYNLH